METTFDPYAEWLQIPPARRPASHYDLLGLQAFEPDLAKIEKAGVERYSFVRKHQLGKHQSDAIKLLAEITKAKDCLTSPDRKAAYDQELRARSTAADQPVGMSTLSEAAQLAATSRKDDLVSSEVVEDDPLKGRTDKQAKDKKGKDKPSKDSHSQDKQTKDKSSDELGLAPLDSPLSGLNPPLDALESAAAQAAPSAAGAKASPLLSAPRGLGDDDWSEPPELKYKALKAILATVAAVMLLASGWGVVRWWSTYGQSAQRQPFEPNDADQTSPFAPKTGGPNNAAGSGQPQGSTLASGSPNSPAVNPNLTPGTEGIWSGTLSMIVVDQQGLHLAVRTSAGPNPLVFEAHTAISNPALHAALADYLSEAENNGRGDAVRVTGKVVQAAGSSAWNLGGAPAAGFPGQSGQPGMPGLGLGPAGMATRLIPECALVELREIEREGDAASRVVVGNPVLRTPLPKLQDLAWHLRYRPAAQTNVKFDGYVKAVLGNPTRMQITPTPGEQRQVEVRIPNVRTEELLSRNYVSNDKVTIEGVSAPESSLALWVVDGRRVVKTGDVTGASQLDANPAVNPGAVAVDPMPQPGVPGRTTTGTGAGLQTQEAAWQQMVRNVSANVGKRLTSKARFVSWQRADPSLVVSIRFNYENAALVAQPTPEMAALLAKLRSDEIVEFEAVLIGGSDYLPQWRLTSLWSSSDPGSKVTQPISLPVASIGSPSRPATSVAWRPESDQLAIAGSDVALYDAAGKQVFAFPANYQAANVCFSPDGLNLAAITSQRVVRLWNIDDRAEVYNVAILQPLPHVVAFTPSDSRRATGLKLMAVAGTAPQVNAKTPRATQVAAGITIWDLNTRREFDTLAAISLSGVGMMIPSCVAWSGDTRLAIGARGQGLYVSSRSGNKLGDLKTPLLNNAFNADAVRWLANNHLAVQSGATLNIWETTGIKAGQTPQPKLTVYVTTAGFDQAFSSDGRQLVASLGSEVRVWDLVGGKRPPQPKPKPSAVTTPRTPRGMPAGGYPNVVPGGWTEPPPPGGIRGTPRGMAGRPPVSVPLPANQDPGVVLEAFSSSPSGAANMRFGSYGPAAWCPTGDYVAAGDAAGQIIVVDVQADEEVLTLGPLGTTINSLSWSPKGDRLASLHSDGVVRLWDTSSLPMQSTPLAAIEAQVGAEPEVPVANPPATAATGSDTAAKDFTDLASKTRIALNGAKWDEYHANIKKLKSAADLGATEKATIASLQSQFAGKVKAAIAAAKRARSSDRAQYIKLLAEAAEMDPEGPDGNEARRLLAEAIEQALLIDRACPIVNVGELAQIKHRQAVVRQPVT